jgi:nitrate reductase NapE component
MDEENKNPRRHKWPRFALAAVLLFVVLAIAWVSFAVWKVERERNFSIPVSAGAK